MNYPKPNTSLAKKLNPAAWVLTVVILALVVAMRSISFETTTDFTFLPKLNAILNSIAGLFLVLALVFIKKKNYKMHGNMIMIAMFFSVCFLISYVLYHITTEPTYFCKEGAIKIIYLILLLTHVVTAALSLPFILFTFIRGITFQVDRHRKMAKWVWPVWMYVVITGPICYLLLAPCY
jgi:putative membrane protein